ncbi:hypothetical protein BBJ28_00014048 [Nothophytophthora sp. Chile5]|nr:hypothetical protein BBJ28_00014048 [Nothophytophthora sp. Chile5]
MNCWPCPPFAVILVVGGRQLTDSETRQQASDMWASRVLQMALKKSTTGVVGLPVNPNARQDLIKLYRKTLQEVKVRLARAQPAGMRRATVALMWMLWLIVQVLPVEAANYRGAVEQITNFRLKVVETNEDVRYCINCGQLEELIEQAEDELSVIPVYLGASSSVLQTLERSCSLSLTGLCVVGATENKLWETPVEAST